ncbi:hypothetical protein MAM1_0320c09632 [Mucor ambiguus]|uniref:Rho-GAP domain-containing protein n=1 Tax=Mucor ambiguus TaxID=91626 RepID=A0A0C9MH57_9FUNG|nr:hypothetical protein MAM1_0320c09632 [Mucor ambiguus]
MLLIPNSVLLLKVFRKQNCTADDLTHVSIHSVATLMQDTLWCCQERIVPKKVWRVINYETCTLDDLSRFISKRCQNLLVEILDFLVQVMRYKDDNQMDAYHLGEAMGKVTLGPPDCDPIIAEKAGHFLTRMIIEHSKTIHGEKKRLLFRVDSGFAWPSSVVTAKRLPMSKSEAARAKAKSYNRLITKIHKRNYDWVSNANVALYAMLEDDYEPEPTNSFTEPYLSIFSKHLDPVQAIQSPVLFRLVTEASKAIEPIPEDPFADSYLFGEGGRKSIHHKVHPIETQISVAFDDFMPLLRNNIASNYYDGNSNQINHTEGGNHGVANNKSHMKIINSSLSHMKLNLRKPKSQGMHHNQHDYIPEEPQQQYHHEPVHRMSPLPASATNTSSTGHNSDTYAHSNKTLYSADEYNSSSSSNNHNVSKGKQNQVKSMMKRVIKMGTIVPIKKTSQTSIY